MPATATAGRGYLLDVPVYLEPLQPTPNPRVIERWRRVGELRMAVSALIVCDALAQLEERDSKRVWAAWRALLEGRFRWVDVGSEVSAAFREIGAGSGGSAPEGFRRMDRVHGATARAHGLILATTRPAVFAGMPGVATEDWAQPL